MRILLDLDEVLVDFIGGCCRAFKADLALVLQNWTPGEWSCVGPIGKVKGFPLDDKFFWTVIHEKGEAFWADLEPLPWIEDVLDLVKSLTDDWHIVSAPSFCPTSYSGKVKWLKNYFGRGFDRFAITPHKNLFAGKDVLLIDDRESNVKNFIRAGGDGLIFPRHNNGLHTRKQDPVGHIRKMLLPIDKGADRAPKIPQCERRLQGIGGGHPYGFDPDQAV